MQKQLIQDWQNVEFSFQPNAQAEHDLFVADFGSRMTLMEAVQGRPSAKTVLSEELKKLKKDEENATPKQLKVSYEGKGGLTAMILMGTASSFVVQDQMKKAFAAILTAGDDAKIVQINLRGLSATHAQNVLEWVASLCVLTRFRPEIYGKKLEERKPLGKLSVHILTGLNKKVAESIVEKGRILAICNNQSRSLSEMPSNVLHPKSYRDHVEKLAKEWGVAFNFIDVKQLTKKGAGAFLAVCRADLNERAGIVHLHYKGKKAKKKVAIVGKGICFDTGGYNVKVGEYMYGMHQDMSGSAVAVSLFRALVELEAPYEVHCYLALAENLISHEGFRPSDIVVASNGMSIEVINTDAEGRMVLSDTLVIASEQKPDLIIDYATLTGSIIRSIDTRRSGCYSNQLKLSSLAVDVGERCGERVWNFPIGDDYNDALKSEHADIRQCASAAAADHIYAATFLSKFVGKNVPWVHVDLAAESNKGGLGLVPTESTGFGVRFGYELITKVLG